METSPIIVSNMTKSFLAEKHPSIFDLLRGNPQRITVLEDIGFEVPRGKMMGIMGRNGAGKSTLLRIVGGVYLPNEGNVVTTGDVTSLFELGSFFNNELTGIQYCNDYFAFRGFSGEQLDAIITSISEFTGLGDFFFEPVRSYSSGMKAKLLFAVATAVPADVILVDEILIVGDEYFQAKAWRRMKRFLAAGATGLIVSHDWTALFKLCQQVMVLQDKKVAYLGDTAEGIRFYLDIPVPEAKEVEIVDKHVLRSQQNVYRSGEPFDFKFKIRFFDGFSRDRIGVAFAIERQEFGVGLSVVFSGSRTLKVDPKNNLADVNIKISDFCLAPGEYCISLFITSEIKGPGVPVDIIFDQMSWSIGTHIRIRVDGAREDGSIIQKRLKWKSTTSD